MSRWADRVIQESWRQLFASESATGETSEETGVLSESWRQLFVGKSATLRVLVAEALLVGIGY
jgi:hypothetical protein